ncbi:branched-chain amino acid ABC transporter permease [Bradyrhizobium sp. 1(2017)]|uniref:branched-chain amino acid ABC transporter permease n=1 Tax=Bradyrhizobium sp. 1(2017) TaxID=1404888 RepID=UPI00140EE22A|nr:branched-chain amino acid ABC transporter permease [Bradyrhizobium sp. 1(2017)]QIO34847.1 branched-chain amino acid ABC transporter permease [Bradyrhizobium sp. 1(2017)]
MIPSTTKPMHYLGVAMAVIVAALLPWFAPNQFYIHLATVGCINLMLVLGLAVIARAGQLSMGHGGFALVGGYVSALLSMKGWPPLLTLFIAGLVAAVIAAALGWIILRLRGVYFVLVAFAFGQIAVLLALDMSSITGGANGLVGVPPISIFGYVLRAKPQFYPFALACALTTLLLIWLLYRSPLGTMMAATAENQRLTESSGIDTHRVQVIAFTIGSGIAGFAGALSTHYLRFISPDSYTFWESVSYLTMLVVGGRDGVLGPIVGVLVLTPLPELLRSTEGLQHIIYGAVLVLCLIFVPNGLASLVQTWRSRQRVVAAGTARVAEEVT